MPGSQHFPVEAPAPVRAGGSHDSEGHGANQDTPAHGPRHAAQVRPGLTVRTLMLGLLIAGLLAAGLELAHASYRGFPEAVEHVIGIYPKVGLQGWFVIWVFLLLLHALTGRLWVATALMTVAVGFIGAADVLKFEFRGEPIYPTDAAYLAEAEILVQSIGTSTALALAAALLALVTVMWLVARVVTRRSPNPRPSWRTRVALGLAAGVGVLAIATFNNSGNPLRETYAASGVYWVTWNQVQNYGDNGFIAGALYNLPTDAMETPEGYSQATMDDLLVRYEAQAAKTNASRDAQALADTNVIVILGESLSDPTQIGITPAEDPIPFLRALMDSNPSGTMQTPSFGGGTATVEFEVLTGMAVANFEPHASSPYQALVSQQDEFPSLLAAFPDHEPLAIHPYSETFYRRNVVYPALGFENALFRDDMAHREKNPGSLYISDASMYAEIIDQLNATDEPMLINAVSMQNHTPYKGYGDPIEVEGPLTDAQEATAGQYLRGLKLADDALAEFVASLAVLEEPTIVLLYGDHLPSVWPTDLMPGTTQYETPWVVFANYELPGVQSDVPVVGPNQLVNQLLDVAGAPYSPWNALLAEVAKYAPVMGSSGWKDALGEPVTEKRLSIRASDVLADYRLAQYDLAVGDSWVTQQLLAPVG